jgi:hypothetical protein
LGPYKKSYEETIRTITQDKNMQAKVNERRNVAKTELYKKNVVEYVRYNNDKLDDFDNMVNDSYLTINHLQGIAYHYRRVIMIINTDPTQRITCIIFRDEKYTLTASLHKQKKYMNLYQVQLNDKFKDAKSVSLEEFLKYVNKELYSEFTVDSTIFNVLMVAVKLDYMIAYINEEIHSRLLQMWNRNNILDYVSPKINVISIPSQIINNSLLNLSNIPVVQNDNIVSLQYKISHSHRYRHSHNSGNSKNKNSNY